MEYCTFEFFKTKLESIEKKLNEIKHKENTMAQTLADLQAAITAIGEAVAADVAQDLKVVEAINALIAKIEALGNPDLTAEVQALATIASQLTSDNAAVQEAIDKAVPPVTPA
jgi:predicted transcriptional regulator